MQFNEHNDDVIEVEEETSSKRSEKDIFADGATSTAKKQLEEGVKGRGPRFEEIAKHEAQYQGEKTKALRGRNNIPFDSVVTRGFVDTLVSKIDESLQISFERAPGREQDKKASQKVSAVMEHESGPDQGMWDLKDIGVKKLAVFSGRGIYKKFASRVDGKFQDHMESVDHWDFVTEPQGGGFLDKHLYKGQMNIFRTRSEMEAMAEKGIYNKRQVHKLFIGTSGTEHKRNQELYNSKISRMGSYGIDYETNNYIGSKLYRLTEWVMFYRGQWTYLVFNYDTGIWVRCEPLEDVFSVAKKKPGRGPWVSWATHFDPFIFWSISPMDSVRPIATAMKKIINLSLDNLEKRNWNQRAYDPNVFEPRDLLWKDQGLVKAKIRPGQPIGNHIYTFETPDTTGLTINLVDYMDAFLGKNTGITAAAQGKGDETRVGIFVGNLEQVADRLGLTNKMYEQAHVDLGVNFQYGLLDHMKEKYAVKVIGNSGIEWNEELLRKEVDRQFTIRVRGTNSEEQANALQTQQKEKSLIMIGRDPELRQATNKTWRLRETLELGGYDMEQIRVAADTNTDADDDILSEAAAAIEEIIEGRKPKKNRGATTGYVRKIIEFAWDTDLDDDVFKKLLAFAEIHIPIAQRNAQRKIAQIIATNAVTERLAPPSQPGALPSPVQPNSEGELTVEGGTNI